MCHVCVLCDSASNFVAFYTQSPSEKNHSGQNDYRCKSLIYSKTVSVSKKITELFLHDLLIPKT